jgi:hypothetical protein
MQNPTATRGSICGETPATRDQPQDSGQMAKAVLVDPPSYRAENRPVPTVEQEATIVAFRKHTLLPLDVASMRSKLPFPSKPVLRCIAV